MSSSTVAARSTRSRDVYARRAQPARRRRRSRRWSSSCWSGVRWTSPSYSCSIRVPSSNRSPRATNAPRSYTSNWGVTAAPISRWNSRSTVSQADSDRRVRVSRRRRRGAPRTRCSAAEVNSAAVTNPRLRAQSTAISASRSVRSWHRASSTSGTDAIGSPPADLGSPSRFPRSARRPGLRTGCAPGGRCTTRPGLRGRGGSHSPSSRAAVTWVKHVPGGRAASQAVSVARTESSASAFRCAPRVTGTHRPLALRVRLDSLVSMRKESGLAGPVAGVSSAPPVENASGAYASGIPVDARRARRLTGWESSRSRARSCWSRSWPSSASSCSRSSRR